MQINYVTLKCRVNFIKSIYPLYTYMERLKLSAIVCYGEVVRNCRVFLSGYGRGGRLNWKCQYTPTESIVLEPANLFM